jgi:AcrR family transcriptional regulator
LLTTGAYEAVTVEAVAESLNVSRATLYRTVPTKQALLGIVFERGIAELFRDVSTVVDEGTEPGAVLLSLIRIQIGTAIRMRHSLNVFFDGADLPPDVVERWRTWSHDYEALWQSVVRNAIDTGFLAQSDPVVTTRLILGMIIWVSRWYQPGQLMTADEIADAAAALITRLQK